MASFIKIGALCKIARNPKGTPFENFERSNFLLGMTPCLAHILIQGCRSIFILWVRWLKLTVWRVEGIKVYCIKIEGYSQRPLVTKQCHLQIRYIAFYNWQVKVYNPYYTLSSEETQQTELESKIYEFVLSLAVKISDVLRDSKICFWNK